ncbi:hypothetical protein EML15_07415 [Corynebacterium sp. sy017]|uniref:hypothetical protein n=1 Tax=unclassified Corynebacterium TaxID=2624378 RepID=UPI00118483D5|nr:MULTISPECIES: hypothetical protein [unclassified Corynebacterium]MBP3088972.1 hypothetical protein [Corynebacterium sp. sy017]QDZ42343.1 hypothetical protein FQV43_03575 [Corynebacterium sp. sy039]TSD91296.1 hypothetical protein ELY17_07425 [Corynebacterium sp. SY003]
MGKKKQVGTAILIAALGLAGCTIMEPHADPVPESTQVVRVLVNGDSFEQIILGELYRQILDRNGREAHIRVVTEEVDPYAELLAHNSDVYIGCAGSLLSHYDAMKARELEEKYGQKQQLSPTEQAEQREDTYYGVVGSLDEGLAASDPSNAKCASREGIALPENLVPIYRTPVLARAGRLALNEVSGSISSEELAELVEKARKGEPAEVVAAEFLDSKSL